MREDGTLVLYAFSEENWQRPQREIDLLFKLLKRFLVEERPTLMKNRVRLLHSGRTARLAKEYPATNEFRAGIAGVYDPLGILLRPQLRALQAVGLTLTGTVLLVISLAIAFTVTMGVVAVWALESVIARKDQVITVHARNTGDASLGAETFAADNPPYGALITYYLKADAREPVVVTVADASGNTIRTLRQSGAKAGINRVAWDLRYEGPRPAESQREPAGGGGGGGGGRFGFGGGPYVVPGQYTVTLRAAGQEFKQTVRVEGDPRVQVAAADYQAQLQAALELRELISQVNGVVDRTEDLRKQLSSLADQLRLGGVAAAATGQDGNGRARADTAVVAAVQAALKRVTDLRESLTRPTPSMGYRQYPRLREELTSLAGSVMRPLAPPTEAQKRRLGELKEQTARVVAEMNAIVGETVPELNRMLGTYPHVVGGAPVR